MTDPRAVGVFDSGVGGLTVLREIIRRSPAESTIYLGDNGRAPYGVRPDDEVLAFSTQALDALAEREVKAIVVACNTSTAVGLPAFRRRYPMPVLGVVRPGATTAALATRNGRVGVIATPATIRSHAYRDAIRLERADIEVRELATPTLVPLVEAGRVRGPEAEAAVAEALAPMFGSVGGGDGAGSDLAVDTLLLGCTHYPLLRPIIAATVGPGIAIVDSAAATASVLAELLEADGIDAPADGPATHVQFTTGDAGRFHELAAPLFGDAFPEVRSIELAVGAA